MHIISVSDFSLWMNTEERGVEDSRSAKTTGVYRVFFSVTLGTHEAYDTSPCKLTNQDTRSYEPPSAVSMHPSLKAKVKIRQRTGARTDRKPCTAKSSGSAEPNSCREMDVRQSKAKSQDQGCPPKRVGNGDCTTKSASHGEPAGDRVRLSEE